MVFHKLWKEKMVIWEQRAKKVRKYKGFCKRYVENHVGNVDKKPDIFPQKSVENKNKEKSPFFGDLWKPIGWKF